MSKLRSEFEKKYGFDGVDFVKQAGNEYFGAVKSLGIEFVLKNYAEKKGYNVEINDEFLSRLIEALAEAGEKFPENQKVGIDNFKELEISPIDPSVPKSKGTLQDFKNIVGSDDLRPVMQGVYVSDDGFLVGTDAHKLVKYKTVQFVKDKGKIINLKIYIGTKGDKISFIDEKFPNYEAVIPRNNEYKIDNLDTYAFYNLCKSAIALKKLQYSDIFNIHFKEKGLEFAFNPILFGELLEFALAKGFDKFDLEFSQSNRAFLLKFEDGSEGIIMPILAVDNKGTKTYTFEQVESEFSGGGKTKAKSKVLPKATPKQPKKNEPYKKFEGDLSDVTYIPRRDISLIVLKNGQELSSADIIDGVYQLKSKNKYAKGGRTYAEAQAEWNKKAGVPSKQEAIQYVKDNPEILLLKNGGSVEKGFITLIFDGKEHKYEAFFVDGKLNEISLPTNSDSPLFKYIENEFENWIEDNEGRDVVDMYYSDEAIYSKKGAILGSIEEISNIMEEDNLHRLNLDKDESDLTATWYGNGGKLKKGVKVAQKYTKLAVKKSKPIVKKGVKVTKKYGKIAIKKSKPIVKKGIEKAKIGFDALAKKVAKRYEGSAVQKKYQELYGKIYSKKEAEEVGRKVASKVYREQQGK